MDLGFPTVWAAKDTVVLVGVIGAVLLTLFALYLQRLADRASTNAAVPEIDNRLGEDATARQERLATERAVRRAAVARAQLHHHSSAAAFVMAVVAADVASVPWLALPGLVVSGVCAVVYYVRFQGGKTKIDQRLAILDLIRGISTRSLNGPYMMDTQIYAAIEGVFAYPDDRLDALERDLQIALVRQSDELRAYEQRRHHNNLNDVDGQDPQTS